MCELPSGGTTTVIAGDVATDQPSGTRNVLPSGSAQGVAVVITLAVVTGATGTGAGFGSALAAGTGEGEGEAEGTVDVGFGDDEHAARNAAHRKLLMRGP